MIRSGDVLRHQFDEYLLDTAETGESGAHSSFLR
jgi:hypothetical protein